MSSSSAGSTHNPRLPDAARRAAHRLAAQGGRRPAVVGLLGATAWFSNRSSSTTRSGTSACSRARASSASTSTTGIWSCSSSKAPPPLAARGGRRRRPDGTALEGRQLKDMVGPLRQDAPYQLQVLRRKGEIPLSGASVAKIGKRHAGAAFELTPRRARWSTPAAASSSSPPTRRRGPVVRRAERHAARPRGRDGGGGRRRRAARQLALIETEEINPTEEVR